MNKLSVILFIIILAIFGGIVVITQKDSIKKSLLTGIPTPPLPTGADQLQFINANQPQAPQGAQQQQQTAQGQQQQQAAQGDANQSQTFGVEEEPRASYSATLRTSKGTIELTLDAKDAPKTVQNFIAKAKSNFYNGLIFHRVEDWVVQGGDPKGNGTGGGLMQTELNQVPFVTGSLGVARGGNIQISNDSQFFITKSDASWLNGQYTNFGIVTSGMDVVNNLKIGDKILGITVE
jgi:peptidyl-prolyl cis-trans isomerase B (cyclophilin B)